jgi:2-polyprenyl-3-methyl-5-hydroxy-6-metoxy-1,4-benzoquinol methylase
MVIADTKKTPGVKSWLSQELDRLEAPDQTFWGHRDIVIRSLARYHFVAPHLHGATLDVGCGRGYGFDIIQPNSSSAIGLDVSYGFLRDAQAREPNRLLVLGSGDRLPFTSRSFASIVCFEVIEHIEDDVAFLRDLRRLARPQASIAISTPNKLIASGDRDKPLNPFHVREYVADEFIRLLRQEFSIVTVYGQHESAGRISTNRLIDRIPMRWKYLIPTHLQGLASVALRAPLSLEDCRFEMHNLEIAHTFLALCHP